MCPECSEKLYSCENCRWFGEDSFINTLDNVTTYDYCKKFEKSCYHIRKKVFFKQHCPCWELPSNFNFCKSCGRPLK